MLDSLVRVSRRVGGATDLLVTEMPAAPTSALAIRAGSSTRRNRGRQEPGACHNKLQQTSPRSTPHRQRFVTSSPAEVQSSADESPRAQSSRIRHAQRTPNPQPESAEANFENPSVYHYTVSRTLELSLQSSFQLSLTVLVRYRSRGHI
jgi:hypothetical protein